MCALTTNRKLTDEKLLKQKRMEAARKWVDDYRQSGCSRLKLKECDNMTLNEVALITKILMKENGIRLIDQLNMPEPYFFVCQKLYSIFDRKPGGSGSLNENKQVNIEYFLDIIHSVHGYIDVLNDWDPEINDNFTRYALRWKIYSIFREENRIKKATEEIYHDLINELANSLIEPVFERLIPVLYIILMYVKELPHKILIFLYVTLFCKKAENIDWQKFYQEGFSKNLNQLCKEIYSQKINDEFNSVLHDLYENMYLKTRIYDTYASRRYSPLILSVGKDTRIGDIAVSSFFSEYHINNMQDTDYLMVRNVISQWISRIRAEAKLILMDKERILDLNDILKNS